jgi:arsenate reductase
MIPKVKELLSTLFNENDLIKKERKEQLEHLASIIKEHIANFGNANVNFICTHNSRRSQIAEIMLRNALTYNNEENITTFSGGTAVTACNARTIMAFERSGFNITSLVEGVNPVLSISGSDEIDKNHLIFSKTFDNPYNPDSNFIAVMVCGDADENCPYIPGANRFSLTYIDPKFSDDTVDEPFVYDAKLKEIGREMCYLCSVLNL